MRIWGLGVYLYFWSSSHIKEDIESVALSEKYKISLHCHLKWLKIQSHIYMRKMINIPGLLERKRWFFGWIFCSAAFFITHFLMCIYLFSQIFSPYVAFSEDLKLGSDRVLVLKTLFMLYVFWLSCPSLLSIPYDLPLDLVGYLSVSLSMGKKKTVFTILLREKI